MSDVNQPGMSVEDFFADGAKHESVKFPSIGDKFSGTVVEQGIQQQREFTNDGTPGALKVWSDNKPMMQSVLTCVDDLDGETRRLYVKGRMTKKAKAALRAEGLSSFLPGTHVEVEHYEVATNKAKEYHVKVKAGSVLDIQTETTPHPATPPAERKPIAEAVAETKDAFEQKKADPSGLSEEQLAVLKASGLV